MSKNGFSYKDLSLQEPEHVEAEEQPSLVAFTIALFFTVGILIVSAIQKPKEVSNRAVASKTVIVDVVNSEKNQNLKDKK